MLDHSTIGRLPRHLWPQLHEPVIVHESQASSQTERYK